MRLSRAIRFTYGKFKVMNIFSKESFRDLPYYLRRSAVRLAVSDQVNVNEYPLVGRLRHEGGERFAVELLTGNVVPLLSFNSVRLTGLFDVQDGVWDLICDDALEITVNLLLGLSHGTRFPIEVHLSGSLLEVRGQMGGVWVTTEQVLIPEHIIVLAPRMVNIITTAISQNPTNHGIR